MAIYVTDTHPLVWYLENRHGKLSQKAIRIFDAAVRAVRGDALVYIPAVVLWEITFLVKLGRIALREPFAHWAARLLAMPGFDLAPLDVEVIAEAAAWTVHDPFDAVIAATARIKDAPLITKDQSLVDSSLVEIAW